MERPFLGDLLNAGYLLSYFRLHDQKLNPPHALQVVLGSRTMVHASWST